MRGAIEHGTDQIIHRRVDHHESFLAAVFHVKHAREQHTGRADERAAGLDDQAAAERTDDFGESFRVGRCWQRGLRRYSGCRGRRRCRYIRDGFRCAPDRARTTQAARAPAGMAHAENLRAKMRGDAAPGDPRRSFVDQIQISRRAPGHTEFVFVRAGGDVRVSAGEHVGIHADSHARPRAARGHVAR